MPFSNSAGAMLESNWRWQTRCCVRIISGGAAWVGEARLHGVKIDLADWLDAQCLFGLGQVGAARGLCEDLMTRGDTELAAAAFALLLRQGVDDDAPFADVETFLIGVLERTGKRALVLSG